MELRKDPVTQSWMLVGGAGDADEARAEQSGPCPICTGTLPTRPIYQSPCGQVRVYPHPNPLYRIEGAEEKAAEGIYDRMRTLGAHEVIVENPTHDREFPVASDREVAVVLSSVAARISDLKKDLRFRYVTVFKNRGRLAGEDFSHAHLQITCTPFIPRRMTYELRSSRAYFQSKERCVFCDIVNQEEERGARVVEVSQNYLAMCPFAPRVPYELWIVPRYHAASFEEDVVKRDNQELAGILRRSVARVERVAEAYHMVLHTTPNTATQRGVKKQWTTVAEDYHWHFEIMPISEKRTKSYSIKEVYYSAVSPEQAAQVLRQMM